MAFDDPQVFDDLQIISNASIDFNDPTDFDDPQMFGSKGTTIGSIDLIIFDGLVDVIANGLVFVHYLSTCPVLSLYLSSIYPPAQYCPCICPVFIHLPSIVLVFVQYLSTCPGQSRGKDLCEEANLPLSSFSSGSRAPPRVSILST